MQATQLLPIGCLADDFQTEIERMEEQRRSEEFLNRIERENEEKLLELQAPIYCI